MFLVGCDWVDGSRACQAWVVRCLEVGEAYVSAEPGQVSVMQVCRMVIGEDPQLVGAKWIALD